MNIAVAAGLLRIRPRRGRNERRQAFLSTEDVQVAIRLSHAESPIFYEQTEVRSGHSKQLYIAAIKQYFNKVVFACYLTQ